jgi:hypothetical protein
MFETRTNPTRKRGKRAKVANSNFQPCHGVVDLTSLESMKYSSSTQHPCEKDREPGGRGENELVRGGRGTKEGACQPASLKRRSRREEQRQEREGEGRRKRKRPSGEGRGEERGPGAQGGNESCSSKEQRGNMGAERRNPKRENKQGGGGREEEDSLERRARRKGGALTCACMTSFTSDSEWMVASSLVTACLRACGRAASRPVVRGCPVRSRR